MCSSNKILLSSFFSFVYLSLGNKFNILLLYECSMLVVEIHHLFMSGTLSGSNCLAPFPLLLIVVSLCWQVLLINFSIRYFAKPLCAFK
jgi:hypothetical protein